MKTWWIVPCALTLAACSSKPVDPAPRSTAGAASVATPFDALKADEQRARDVQKIVDKQAAEQRKQVEAQTQ